MEGIETAWATYLSPRHRRLLLFVLPGLAVSLSAGAAERLVDAPEPRPFRVWPSTPSVDCPFPKSETLVGLVFVVTGVKKGSPNIGLSEIAVFTAGR